jgi:hypothetical protein
LLIFFLPIIFFLFFCRKKINFCPITTPHFIFFFLLFFFGVGVGKKKNIILGLHMEDTTAPLPLARCSDASEVPIVYVDDDEWQLLLQCDASTVDHPSPSALVPDSLPNLPPPPAVLALQPSRPPGLHAQKRRLCLSLSRRKPSAQCPPPRPLPSLTPSQLAFHPADWVVNLSFRAPDGRLPAYDVYVGRTMKRLGLTDAGWGNPHRVGNGVDRETAVKRYCVHLVKNGALMQRARELRGKVLACWCAPQMCHANVLAWLANAPQGVPFPGVEALHRPAAST